MSESSSDIRIVFDLHACQMEVFQDRTRFRVLVAGRRFGKSHLAVSEACCAALDPANVLRQPVFLIAPTQPQAKIIYWRQLVDKLYPVTVNTNVNEGLITLNNGVMVGIKGADNPDALRGPGLWMAILDEYANMKPFVWGEIIRPALADSRGRALFIGTPAGRNHFFDTYQNAASGTDPEWKAWHFESIQNPFLPLGEVEAARRTMSSAAFNKEFRASFETGTGGHFKQEAIKYADEVPKECQWFVAVDLAGFTGIEKATTSKQRLLDKHAIVVVGVNDKEDWFVKDIQVGRWGVEETASRIVTAVVDAEPTAWGIERGALFNAVMPYVNRIAAERKKHLPRPSALSHENKVKNERILWALQGRMEHGKVTFLRAEWNREMEDQLLQFPSKMVHDDIPDALAYIAQLTEGKCFFDFSEFDTDDPYWEPLDKRIGV